MIMNHNYEPHEEIKRAIEEYIRQLSSNSVPSRGAGNLPTLAQQSTQTQQQQQLEQLLLIQLGLQRNESPQPTQQQALDAALLQHLLGGSSGTGAVAGQMRSSVQQLHDQGANNAFVSGSSSLPSSSSQDALENPIQQYDSAVTTAGNPLTSLQRFLLQNQHQHQLERQGESMSRSIWQQEQQQQQQNHLAPALQQLLLQRAPTTFSQLFGQQQQLNLQNGREMVLQQQLNEPNLSPSAVLLLEQQAQQKITESSLLQSLLQQQQELQQNEYERSSQNNLASLPILPASRQAQEEYPRLAQLSEQQSSTEAKHNVPLKGIPLTQPSDKLFLSAYQNFIRDHLELFIADQRDCLTNQQGRRKRVQYGQVGIRCRHCAHLQKRARASCYYPQKIIGVYQAAQNIATTHLAVSCPCVPQSVRDDLNKLHQRKDTAAGGKVYWANGCARMGLRDDENNECIRFGPPGP